MKNSRLIFEYTAGRKKSAVIFFLLWLLLLVWGFLSDDVITLVRVNFVILGIWFGFMAYFQAFRGYVEVKNGVLYINIIPPKKVHLSQIVHIRYAAGDYILETAGKKLRIVKSEIHKDQIEEFENFMEELKSQILN